MDLILTHEQTDFDALASLIAAHKLYPGATPIRPRNLNRNVTAFLTIFGGELPLTDPDALHRQAIGQVFLVDTQRLVSVRGIRAKTPIHVIDHHPPYNLPEDWTCTIELLGSTTSILVEKLREKNIPLTPVEATLLLLGIYEDTGNLTYLSTTPRDAMAAAYLLGYRPRLEAIRNFLSHPLSPEQQALYQELLQQAETIRHTGHAVMLATGSIDDSQVEISPVVQALRDAVDAVAVLAVVQMGRDVELVARSTTDAIDVGVVARQLGGGGHERAAAAMILDSTVQQVASQIRAVLGKAVKPPVTVAHIMSRGAQTLPTHTTTTQAAAHLRRYGHEGDLVVDEEENVVGLITRKAVDRAMAHGLGNQPIETIMESGQISVTPDDTLEYLQQVMIESGWGQVPVTQDGKLQGIVTRTDLIKQLAHPDRELHPTLADKLAQALPAPRLAFLRELGEMAHAQEVALFIVGGFVRDLLLDTPSLDFDLVVEGNAIKLAEALQDAYRGRVVTHRRFGTAKWFLSEQLAQQVDLDTLDLVSARQEFYAHPSALPQVEHSSIKHDLHRRDFTINTLAIQVNGEHFGELLDYYGGERDLKEGRIRVLHSLSFVDDATRLLRAVRLATRFGFTIERRTAQLMTQALPMLAQVSGDRVRHELEAILKEPTGAIILQQLDELGILTAIHPALYSDTLLGQRLDTVNQFAPEDRVPLGFAVWLGVLPGEQLAAVLKRLNIPARLGKPIQQLPALCGFMQTLAPDSTLSEIDRQLYSVEPLIWQALPILLDEHLANRLHSYYQKLDDIRPTLTGSELIAQGYPRGPEIGVILKQLRRAWLDDEITSAEDERRWLAAHPLQQ